MNFRALTLSALLGLSAPMVAGELFNPAPVAAQSLMMGDYMNDNWFISLWFENGTMHYQGTDRRRPNNSMYLSGATESGTRDRQIYTWRNGGHRYQVTWRPSDPDYIRLQVFDPNGRELVNNLLERIPFSP
ncbi:hypothetical protein [Phormidium sp. FACHB-1136]|jgi:hypothetical protein|uniref:hypothetical protein n=1 Tax=Phormidium sp. FACHB-1136 TaxID=2692848 RepID=UPI0016838443|nr:hypothetical protein [Phormidium sp. FACHB-1136]MBD2425827.1 hypothetical protein [Phormidium sp. FACHB-1136]